MASSNSMSTWEPFPLSSRASAHPPLFLRRDFTSTDYSVYVTDLTNIWGETLSKGRIHDRAEDTEASIDPTTDESQLGILLSKLHDGLGGGGGSCNGHVDVELDVRKSSDHDYGGCQINITTKEELPKPLRPLAWKFRLKPLPQDKLTVLVMLPALASNSLLARQVDSLLVIIQEKDSIGQRMLDKLREIKVDLRSVFPGRKLSSTIDEHVQFDEERWRQEVDNGDVGDKTAITAPFGTVSSELQATHGSPGYWWSEWKGKQHRARKSDEETHAAPKIEREPTLMSESSFERLKTPPKRASPKAIPPVAEEEEENETTDDDDFKKLPSPPNASKEKSRMSEDHDMIKDENADSSATAMDDPSEAAKVDEKETTDDEAEEPPPPPKTTRGVIKGKIGGKKAPPSDVEMKSNDASEDDEDTPEPTPKKTGKVLRTIGKKKDTDAESNQPNKRKVDEDDEDKYKKDAGILRTNRSNRTKSPEQEEATEAVVDKKRAELAKRLEAQRKAPVKKHRKF